LPANRSRRYESGSSLLQLTNLHGDVVATVPNHVPTATDAAGASTTAYFETTEYGAARDPAAMARYGWLGGARRSGDALASLVLTGARLYNPATGRFLQRDPVPGGSANDYDYCSGDPVNCDDASGKSSKLPTSKHMFNSYEWKRCGRHPAQCLDYVTVSIKVFKKVKKVFGNKKHTQGKRNAYRHCLWQALLTYRMGSSNANLGQQAGKYKTEKNAWKFICKWCKDLLNRGALNTNGGE
jgi:RHS repeat-associated protein